MLRDEGWDLKTEERARRQENESVTMANLFDVKDETCVHLNLCYIVETRIKCLVIIMVNLHVNGVVKNQKNTTQTSIEKRNSAQRLDRALHPYSETTAQTRPRQNKTHAVYTIIIYYYPSHKHTTTSVFGDVPKIFVFEMHAICIR